MKLRIMGVEEDLIAFSNLLRELQNNGKIQLISASKPYPNRNSIEMRGYSEIKILDEKEARIPGIENKQTKVDVLREDEVLFSLFFNDSEEAKCFLQYFNTNISNCDEAIIQD